MEMSCGDEVMVVIVDEVSAKGWDEVGRRLLNDESWG